LVFFFANKDLVFPGPIRIPIKNHPVPLGNAAPIHIGMGLGKTGRDGSFQCFRFSFFFVKQLITIMMSAVNAISI